MSSRSPALRIALVGAGSMGSYHARVVSQSSRAEIACVVDPAESDGRAVAERYGGVWVPDLDDLSPFDALIVACTTAAHVEWGRRAIAAGKPVLVEKPLSEDLPACETLIADAAAHGVPLMCGLLERFNPAVRTLFDIVEQPIHVTTVRHSPYVPRVATGVAYDLMIHDVDLVLRMAHGARPRGLKSTLGHVHPKSLPGAEDVAELALSFDEGLVAALSASRVSQRKIRTLEVAELERLIEVDLVRQDITVYRHIGADFLEGSHTGYRQQTVIDIPALEYGGEPLAAQLEYFVALARGEGDPDAELATLLEPHRVIARAIEDARNSPG